MRKYAAFALSLLFLAPAGCKKQPPAEPPEIVLLEKREAAQRRAEALLKGLDQKIADIRARAESSAAGAKSETRETLQDLEEKKTRVQLKLEELKTSSKNAVKDVTAGLETAVDDLERSYKDAATRFK